MKSALPLAIVWLLQVMSFADSGLQKVDYYAPPPKNLAVSLKLPASAVIGDHVDAEFIIKNTGEAAFEIYAQEAVEAEVNDGKGNSVPPDSPPFDLGAHPFGTVVEPGKSISLHFAVEKFAMILLPSTYTISAWDGLGWNIDREHPEPLATAKIEFKQPTAEYAAARVHELCGRKIAKDAPDASRRSWEAGWELQHLFDPAYLPALREEARAGRARACLGIGSIVAEEANEALLELSQSTDPEMVMAATVSLVARVPLGPLSEQKQPLQKTWRERFDEPVRKLAAQLLGGALQKSKEKNGSDPVTNFYVQSEIPADEGAVILQRRGDPDRADALLQAMDRALRLPMKPRRGNDVLMWQIGPLQSMIAAMDDLRRHGWRTDGAARFGAGSQLAFCRQLADPAIPKPEGNAWQESVRTALVDKSPIVRENAVRAIPLPLTDEWAKLLLSALKDEDGDVGVAACAVAGNSGRKNLIRPLLQTITGGPDYALVRAAAEAAAKLGAGLELWEALCEVIPDDEKAPEAVRQLIPGTIALPPTDEIGTSSYGWTQEQRLLLHDAWRTFLARNRALLKSGQRVPPADASVTGPLTGASFTTGRVAIRLKNGTDWPPRPK